jgi:hypothetical protein
MGGPFGQGKKSNSLVALSQVSGRSLTESGNIVLAITLPDVQHVVRTREPQHTMYVLSTHNEPAISDPAY